MRGTRGTIRTVLASSVIGWSLSACASAALVPLSATPGPSHADEPRSTLSPSTITRTIDSLFDQPVFRTASWGALVLGPNGDTVYMRNAAKLMTPASNMKVVTGAVALAQLGPDFRFRDTAAALPLRDTVPRDFGPMYDTLMVRTSSLRDILPKMLKPSQNRLAEQLFYTIALERTGTISRDSAAAVTKRQLTAWGVPLDGYIIRDGSGYERADFLSPETITRILTIMQRDSAFAFWYESFPVAGVDGTLANRMRATLAERNAHAKTGSLGAVRALSGYVTTAGGAQLTFSIICNGFTTPPEVVTSTMDRAVVTLAALPNRP